MRRLRREQQPASMFHGAELRRLIVGVMMLFLLGMLIVQAGKPSNWHWLASASAQPPKEPTGPPPPLPKATGLTDEDPEEAEAAWKNDFLTLTDGTTNLSKAEMAPYDRLVRWVNNQSFERLNRRAKKDLWYTADQHISLTTQGGLAHRAHQESQQFLIDHRAEASLFEFIPIHRTWPRQALWRRHRFP